MFLPYGELYLIARTADRFYTYSYIMTILLLIWLLVFLQSFVIGSAIRNWINAGSVPHAKPFTSVLIGLGATMVISEIMSLFIKTGLVTFGVLLITTILLVIFDRSVRASILSIDVDNSWMNWLAYVLLVLLIAGLTLRPVSNPDTNIYHAQAIRWIESFPAVPGLGNLYGRLAFNSSWFVLAAVYSFSFVGGYSYHVLNGFLFAGFALSVTHAILGPSPKGRIARFITGFLFLVFGFSFIASDLSSPGTDTPATILAWWLAWCLLNKEPNEYDPLELVEIGILSFMAVTIKLSSLPLAFIGLAILVNFFYHRQTRYAITLFASGFLFIAPFITRNLILSGYLIYPFPALDLFRFQWKVPLVRVIEERDGILAFGRLPGEKVSEVVKMRFETWFPQWWESLTSARKAIVSFALLSPIAYLLPPLNKKYPAKVWHIFYWVGCMFWLLNSPDLRFGYGMLICAILIPIFAFFDQFPVTLSDFRVAKWVVLVLYLSVNLLTSTSFQMIGLHAWSPQDYDTVPTEQCAIGNANVFCAKQYSACSYHDFPCIPHSRPWVFMTGSNIASGYIGAK